MHPRAIAALFRHLSREICPGGCSIIEYATAKLYFREQSISLRFHVEIFILGLYNILYKISNILYIFLSLFDSSLFLIMKGFRVVFEKFLKKNF